MFGIDRFRQPALGLPLFKFPRRAQEMLRAALLVMLQIFRRQIGTRPFVGQQKSGFGGIIFLGLGGLPAAVLGQPLVMHNRGRRLKNNLEACKADAPGKIDVVALHEKGVRVETAELTKERRGNHDAGARGPAGLSRAGIIVLRMLDRQLLGFDDANICLGEDAQHDLEQARRHDDIRILDQQNVGGV